MSLSFAIRTLKHGADLGTPYGPMLLFLIHVLLRSLFQLLVSQYLIRITKKNQLDRSIFKKNCATHSRMRCNFRWIRIGDGFEAPSFVSFFISNVFI